MDRFSGDSKFLPDVYIFIFLLHMQLYCPVNTNSHGNDESTVMDLQQYLSVVAFLQVSKERAKWCKSSVIPV